MGGINLRRRRGRCDLVHLHSPVAAERIPVVRVEVGILSPTHMRNSQVNKEEADSHIRTLNGCRPRISRSMRIRLNSSSSSRGTVYRRVPPMVVGEEATRTRCRQQ